MYVFAMLVGMLNSDIMLSTESNPVSLKDCNILHSAAVAQSETEEFRQDLILLKAVCVPAISVK